MSDTIKLPGISFLTSNAEHFLKRSAFSIFQYESSHSSKKLKFVSIRGLI
jgi:hypothetical protein